MKKLITKEQLHARNIEIAKEISNIYGDEELTCIVLLRGAFFFGSDLCKLLNNIKIDFLISTSYEGQKSKTNLGYNLISDIREDIVGKNVLIIEDIIDSGDSMIDTINIIRLKKPKSITVVSCLKRKKMIKFIPSDHFIYGFEVGEGFLVGYGLDHNQKQRELEDIYTIE
ncbi:hypothetical protein ASO20_01620 [Mycoplasma sp. (ex Biomphalaria glabrata)]|uniref:phosphoribosyltransferase n=1 Tax=Mycoplasma sp. (ex Biomphalaria glabrata) TaxID=1749074 RepID=UPI00073A8850|nr:phosphoribosyltransferase family protein [Mycoplasma sp. (ex Biomphalaria glabrata)]ALV23348.1 hypothetical protein ASO20_01620 [Mycoplasma sp. (ex Biomphalaria glabrata)]